MLTAVGTIMLFVHLWYARGSPLPREAYADRCKGSIDHDDVEFSHVTSRRRPSHCSPVSDESLGVVTTKTLTQGSAYLPSLLKQDTGVILNRDGISSPLICCSLLTLVQIHARHGAY